MNILIISFDADPPYMGGVATMTNLLAKGFIAKGHSCTLGYMRESEHPSNFFKQKIKLSESYKYSGNKFDIILSQFCNIDYTLLSPLKKQETVILTAYHNRPMLHSLRIEGLLNIYHQSSNILYKLYTLSKIPFLPMYYIKGHYNEKRVFRNAYNNSDKFILLSDKFYPLLKKIIPYAQKEKVAAIGNPVVFDESYPIEELYQKKKRVLIVCSTNHVKRIPVLFKIWKAIEADNNYLDWELTFVGEGEGFKQILKLAQKMNLKRIHFMGYTSPLPFYKESSSMIMASKYEGWPMVLMEGQQMGVIPISYNSFESITDIITNEYNGIIIPNNNIKVFIKRLKALMDNPAKREQMAINAIQFSNKNTKDQTVDQYLNLFKTALNESNPK